MKKKIETTVKIKSKKDYFGWFYNRRNAENKLWLHLYTLLFLIVPIYISVYQSGPFGQMVPVLFFLIFLYAYGFTIHHFPTTREKSIFLVATSTFYLLLVAFTGGEQSVARTLRIDGATLLCAMLLISCFYALKNYERVKLPNKTDYRLICILFSLIYLAALIIAKTISFLNAGNTLQTFFNQGLFLIGVLGALGVHYRYLRDIHSVSYWNSKSKKQTLEIGKSLTRNLRGGDIVTLTGEMGTGKTTLTKGIAEGLGIQKDVTSPTFGLMHVYEVNLPQSSIKNFVHIDTYRLKDAAELVAIGAEEYVGSADTVCIIEWPEKIESLLSGKRVKKIFLEHTGDEKRKITLEN